MFEIKLPRFRLGHLPTPIESLGNLSAHLGGPRLFVKRDDCTGLATGGNKTRKLEYLVADAIEKKADTLITEGGSQSNHCRQTAAAAAKAGLDCLLVLNKGYVEGSNGNVLLDRLLGAEIRVVDTSEERNSAMREAADTLQLQGRRPYLIPTGGSNAVGAFGYVNALAEIETQSREMNIRFDAIVSASGSGGTQGGLVLGRRLFSVETPVIGISDGEPRGELADMVRDVAVSGAALLGQTLEFDDNEITIFDEYYGSAYGVPTPEMIEAVRLLARTEGLLLDPVYSGKAMAGLIDLVDRGHFSNTQNVLFIHTGGTPALFAYQSTFQ